MNKMFGKVAVFGLVTSLLVLTGCNQAGLPAGQSPEDVITEALLNQGEIVESVYEITANADLAGEVEGVANFLKGNARLAGSTNTSNSSMLMNLSFDAEMNEDGVKADLEVRANDDGVFFKIGKIALSDAESQELVELMLEEYLGKWVEASFMTSGDVVESGYAEVDYKEGDPLPFKNIEYVGNTDILGLNSYHFTADIDEDLILSMMGDVPSPDAEAFFASATIKGDVYVAVNEKVITGFGGSMKLNDPEMNGTVEMQVKLNPTRSNKVDTPKAEVQFTEEQMGGLLSGLQMMGPGAGDLGLDDGAMGEDVMSDEEFEELMKMMEEAEGVPGEPGSSLITPEDYPEPIVK